MRITDSQRQAFLDNGVVHIPNCLDDATLALAQRAFDWSLANPGPGAAQLPGNASGEFYQDLANPKAFDHYSELLACPVIGQLIAGLWDADQVWFMYEQVFRKAGGNTRRTPWHQDTSYLPVTGNQLAVMWLSFDPVPAASALEFVRGSHVGTLYNGSLFKAGDDTAPLYKRSAMPRLPDIEENRASYPIVSWSTQPGDVVIFHPSTLHGGAATHAATERRTLSLRFFGESAQVATRPGAVSVLQRDNVDSASVHPLTVMRSTPEGSPFQHPRFPKIYDAGVG